MAAFQGAQPFPHLVIDRALPEGIIEAAADAWPSADWPGWFKYGSSFEAKLACNDRCELPQPCADLLYALNAIPLGDMVGIGDLVPDATFHGGGLHGMGPGGKLDMHLDCDRHPKLGLRRRLNLILYANPEWDDSWNGHLELWDRTMSTCVQRIAPVWNRLVVFETSDFSFHGVPEQIKCPPGTMRRSFATYLWTPDLTDTKRPRAQFVARPQDDRSEAAELSRSLRSKI